MKPSKNTTNTEHVVSAMDQLCLVTGAAAGTAVLNEHVISKIAFDISIRIIE